MASKNKRAYYIDGGDGYGFSRLCDVKHSISMYSDNDIRKMDGVGVYRTIEGKEDVDKWWTIHIRKRKGRPYTSFTS